MGVNYLKMNGRRAIPAIFLIIISILLIFINQNIASGENANIVINEVMYNPISNDNYNEWIEPYNLLSAHLVWLLIVFFRLI